MASEQMNRDPTSILVVEDERHIASFLEFVLKRAGYEVTVVYDGEQALAAVETFAPNAILLDLMLPGLTGLEVLKRLRADPRYASVVIMVLSGRSFGDVPAEVMQAGANEYATKPIGPSTLLQKLADLGVPPAVPTPGQASLPDRRADGND
jgi:two-component system, OmpR family, alkaline phosphatase synthesis response regulator PhoP